MYRATILDYTRIFLQIIRKKFQLQFHVISSQDEIDRSFIDDQSKININPSERNKKKKKKKEWPPKFNRVLQENGTNRSKKKKKRLGGDSSWVYGATIFDYKKHKTRFALMLPTRVREVNWRGRSSKHIHARCQPPLHNRTNRFEWGAGAEITLAALFQPCYQEKSTCTWKSKQIRETHIPSY